MLRKMAKKKISNFISSDFVLLLVCYLGRLFLYKNARNICVAICFGFSKNMFILTGLKILLDFTKLLQMGLSLKWIYMYII